MSAAQGGFSEAFPEGDLRLMKEGEESSLSRRHFLMASPHISYPLGLVGLCGFPAVWFWE
jgi:hypothetical protein